MAASGENGGELSLSLELSPVASLTTMDSVLCNSVHEQLFIQLL